MRNGRQGSVVNSEGEAITEASQVFTHRLHFVHCPLSSYFSLKIGGPEHLVKIFGRRGGMPLGPISFGYAEFKISRRYPTVICSFP